MTPEQFMILKMDIECGKLDCLKNCCSADTLTAIWRVMRGLSQADLPRLEKMLCGCAVPKALPPASKQPQGLLTPGAVPINCTDKLTEWACQPGTQAALQVISSGLAAAAVFAKVPVIGIVLSTVSLIVDDITSGCQELSQGHAHNWTDTLVDKMCGLNAWLDELIKKAPDALQPVAEFIKQVQLQFTPFGLVSAYCCAKTNVGYSLPDPRTIDVSPGAGTNTLPSIPSDIKTIPTSTRNDDVLTLLGPSIPSTQAPGATGATGATGPSA